MRSSSPHAPRPRRRPPGPGVEIGPVAADASDQVALGPGVVGKVLGAHRNAQLGEVVAHGLLGHLEPARTRGPHAELDLAGPQMPVVVEDEIDQELFDELGFHASGEAGNSSGPRR